MSCTYSNCPHPVPDYSRDRNCVFHTSTGKIRTDEQGKKVFIQPGERDIDNRAPVIISEFIQSFHKLLEECKNNNFELVTNEFIFPSLTKEEWFLAWEPVKNNRIHKESMYTYSIPYLDIPFTMGFYKTKFGCKAYFNNSFFANRVEFHEIEFYEETDFSSAIFANDLNLYESHFKHNVLFNGTKFAKYADFWKSRFEGTVDFSRAFITNPILLNNAQFKQEVNFVNTIIKEINFGACDIFSSLRLRELQKIGLNDESSFHIRQNELLKDNLSNAEQIEKQIIQETIRIILEPPIILLKDLRFWENGHLILEDFDISQTSFWQSNLYIVRPRVDFIRVNWGSNKRIYDDDANNCQRYPEEVERIYKQIRLAYEERGNYPDAGEFYLNEMRARTKRLKGFLKLIHCLYGCFSKYGERPFRAFVWFCAFITGESFVILFSGLQKSNTETIFYYLFKYNFNYPNTVNTLWNFLTVMSVVFQSVTLGRTEPYHPMNSLGLITLAITRIFGLSLLALFLLALKRRFRR